jgi:AAA domain/DnaB-like helicase N terminal domain
MTDQVEALNAERAVCGVVMHSKQALTEARRLLSITEFWQPKNATVFRVCCDLADKGEPVEPLAVVQELMRTGEIGKVDGAYIHTLFSLPVTAISVGYYAAQVKMASRRRILMAVGQRLTQSAEEITDGDDLMDFVAREALSLELLLDEKAADAPIEGLSTWGEFLAEPDQPEDWIVPGLIERGEAFLLLAGEGAGKSWLSRQLCMTIAAGVHPFKPKERIPAQRTLLIDLENPIPTVRRQGRPMASQVARLGGDGDNAFIWRRPEGLNIRDRADAQLLERVVAEVQPAFVAIGSLYNAYQTGRDSWETAADEAKVVLNRLRGRYRCALWVEHHMPKGDGTTRPGTPLGSSVWMRWPSYGRVLTRKGQNVYALEKSFRGDRDIREIPAGLMRGGELPWTPIWDQADLELYIEAGEGKMS